MRLAEDGSGTGGIGVSGTPIEIDNPGSTVTLAVSTDGANAFIQSLTDVAINTLSEYSGVDLAGVVLALVDVVTVLACLGLDCSDELGVAEPTVAGAE